MRPERGTGAAGHGDDRAVQFRDGPADHRPGTHPGTLPRVAHLDQDAQARRMPSEREHGGAGHARCAEGLGQGMEGPQGAGGSAGEEHETHPGGARPPAAWHLLRQHGDRRDPGLVAGDNPERIRSEAAFAKLCGACPIPASSGKTNRHRLNKGGNRQGNSALHHIAIVRMRYHQPTRDYVDRKTKEGKGKMEIIRCLKRFIAREAYRALISIHTGATPIGEPPAERGRRLRELRVTHGITQQQVSDALGVHSSRISEIERGTRNLPELERRATIWIQTITTPNQPNQHAETLDNV